MQLITPQSTSEIDANIDANILNSALKGQFTHVDNLGNRHYIDGDGMPFSVTPDYLIN